MDAGLNRTKRLKISSHLGEVTFEVSDVRLDSPVQLVYGSGQRVVESLCRRRAALACLTGTRTGTRMGARGAAVVVPALAASLCCRRPSDSGSWPSAAASPR